MHSASIVFQPPALNDQASSFLVRDPGSGMNRQCMPYRYHAPCHARRWRSDLLACQVLRQLMQKLAAERHMRAFRSHVEQDVDVARSEIQGLMQLLIEI